MDIRSQIVTVFHLDKCIGCHTCSVLCKNTWTDRKGAEYMWWNNVEAKPGTGYPSKWEDQGIYKGGFEAKGDSLKLKSGGKLNALKNIFHNPDMPELKDYYEPWTYKYNELFEAPEGSDQPTARPVSLITGENIDVKSGPNWDDELGGSKDYAASDVNLAKVPEAERKAMLELERIAYFYLPRICNHCLNPACVAACPSGAAYKRGEDGIVLINQDKCRAWRMCVSSCPYKKSYYNWHLGKSEKCILCYPRLESGQAPACMHSCVGRIRYLGVMLYDADRIEAYAKAPDAELVDRQLELYLDPKDPAVIAAAKLAGIADSTITAAQKSPSYKFIKEYKIALPLHPEFRTMPNLFYVPPLSPVIGAVEERGYSFSSKGLIGAVAEMRLPLSYLASLFSGGNLDKVSGVLARMIAVRLRRRAVTVPGAGAAEAEKALAEAGLSAEMADEIYRLTTLAAFGERIVIPPAHREEAIETLEAASDYKGSNGFGTAAKPERGL